MTTHERRKISSNSGLVLPLIWPPSLILRAWYATCWCQWWISTWFQACKVRSFHTCETRAKLYQSGPQAYKLSFTRESHGISKACSYSKRKAQVFAHAGPYLIAVLYPFSLNMSAIYMNASTDKKYRELKWHYFMSSLCWWHLIIQYIPTSGVHFLSICCTLDWFLSVIAICSHNMVQAL